MEAALKSMRLLSTQKDETHKLDFLNRFHTDFSLIAKGFLNQGVSETSQQFSVTKRWISIFFFKIILKNKQTLKFFYSPKVSVASRRLRHITYCFDFTFPIQELITD